MAVSPALQDRLFMLGVGLTACAMIDVMRRMLIHYRASAIEAPAENKPQYITQEVEDSLKLSTLRKLLDSPNFAIQETAVTIVCERVLHDQTSVDILLWHITQPEYEKREQGIRALKEMVNSSTISYIDSPSTYAALIKSLTFSLTDYTHTPFTPGWDNYHLRDVVEKYILQILSQLVLKSGPSELVHHNFVSRWLVHEPWGSTPSERQQNFRNCIDSSTPHFQLNELVHPLVAHRLGHEQLRKAGLLSEDMARAPPLGSRRDAMIPDMRMDGGEGTAGDEDLEAMFVDPGMRRAGQSEEEEHIRRRNREAMVLNDGTRPFERGDIFQRGVDTRGPPSMADWGDENIARPAHATDDAW